MGRRKAHDFTGNPEAAHHWKMHIHTHNGHVGALRMCFSVLNRIMLSPTTTELTKRQAYVIEGQVAQLMKYLNTRDDSMFKNFETVSHKEDLK